MCGRRIIKVIFPRGAQDLSRSRTPYTSKNPPTQSSDSNPRRRAYNWRDLSADTLSEHAYIVKSERSPRIFECTARFCGWPLYCTPAVALKKGLASLAPSLRGASIINDAVLLCAWRPVAVPKSIRLHQEICRLRFGTVKDTSPAANVPTLKYRA